MNKTAYLIVDVDVKFRAWFIDFGKFHERSVVPLPPAAALVLSITGPIPVYGLNRNGVKLTILLTDTDTESQGAA